MARKLYQLKPKNDKCGEIILAVALRNISKNRVFTLINVSGLAIGLASSILILLFIIKEKSFDRFHEHADQIYRLYIDGGIGDQGFRGAWTSMVMAPTFAQRDS